MDSIGGTTYNSTRLLFSAKAVSYETSLRQNLETFQELVLVAEQIQSELETCEAELKTQREKCERKKCCNSENYEKILESKNNIIQLAVSTAIIINETKNLSMISQLLKILCGDVEMLTPPKESQDKENVSNTVLLTPDKKRLHTEIKTNSPVKKKNKSTSPKKNVSTEDVSFKDDSVSEIEGTPGRTSPIIHLKKLKSSSLVSSLSGTSTESRDKKKCPDNWNSNTPEPKQMKLCYPSPKRMGKGKLSRQTRISFVPAKPSSVVDLTCSPELPAATGHSRLASEQSARSINPRPHVQMLIKKESSDNDDTILPSPTSGPPSIALSRTSLIDSQKMKKPLSLLKVKAERVDEVNSPIIQFVEKKSENTTKENEVEPLEESINILKQNRFAKSPHKAIKAEKSPVELQSPPKGKTPPQVRSPEYSQVVQWEPAGAALPLRAHELDQDHNSPSKKPLVENQNVVNVPTDPGRAAENKTRKLLEPVYKEPAVRRKAEKMALPAWCCDECRQFFGNLYEDDAEKIAAVTARCSKHRGPARPATPPGFWHPRWSVPTDTEEFNRRNHAD